MAQHKNRREAAKSQELQELRAENRQLRRQVVKLRRSLEKLQGEVPTEATEEVTPEPKVAVSDFRCSCGCSSFKDFTTPKGTVLRCCTACGKRTKL